MKKYNPWKIEKKWQKKWYNSTIFFAKNSLNKPKFYLLFEFPYPSGEGLHVGHCRPYIGLDIIARKRRMQGQNVLFPVGWDAFGLPTENYALRTGVSPKAATQKNTALFKKQMRSLGLSLDWSREINTSNPEYYKWTQWIFIKLFENNLAYKDKVFVNWCPQDKVSLSNEEVVAGQCERCGTKVEKKEKEQWLIKITKYADRLIKDLDLVNYPDEVKKQQKNWIGKKEGFEIDFPLKDSFEKIKVFTSRPETLFGVTFLVLAPENKIFEKIKNKIKNFSEIEKYILNARNKTDLQRQEEKEKTGVELIGLKAINPANQKEVKIFVSDYVLGWYGTGAIMAVPAHDYRDFDFAKKFNLEIISVISPDSKENLKNQKVFEGQGTLINSGEFNELKSKEAGQKIANKFGKPTTIYKLRDWVFSRQRYWGEPIPMIFCFDCGWIPVPEKDLPVKLPQIKNYHLIKNSESPLASLEKWVKTICPKCKKEAKRETDTMPNWAGSNWYYLAYPLAKELKTNFRAQNLKLNNIFVKSQDKLSYWMPVDWYNGGMEHTTLHLLYSRFIYKFLWDIGAIPKSIESEPYKKRTSHGLILGQGGIKMSKSRGNVINPDQVIKEYGTDVLRIYEMFMGPFDQPISWNPKGIIGAKRFLEKIINLLLNSKISRSNQILPVTGRTIKKVSEDIENMKFNTAISALMILINEFYVNQKKLSYQDIKNFLIIFSPFAPHLSEELWFRLGFRGSCGQQNWPTYDSKIIKEKETIFIIQVNGKVKEKINLPFAVKKEEVEKIILKREKIKKIIKKNKIKKIIFIPNKLINIVT